MFIECLSITKTRTTSQQHTHSSCSLKLIVSWWHFNSLFSCPLPLALFQYPLTSLESDDCMKKGLVYGECSVFFTTNIVTIHRMLIQIGPPWDDDDDDDGKQLKTRVNIVYANHFYGWCRQKLKLFQAEKMSKKKGREQQGHHKLSWIYVGCQVLTMKIFAWKFRRYFKYAEARRKRAHYVITEELLML